MKRKKAIRLIMAMAGGGQRRGAAELVDSQHRAGRDNLGAVLHVACQVVESCMMSGSRASQERLERTLKAMERTIGG